MLRISLLAPLLLLLAVGAQSRGLDKAQTGKCLTVPAQKTVDISQYLGVWYEIYKFPAPFERGGCIQAQYALKQNGRVKVDNSFIENGQEVHAIGEAYRPDDKEQGKLKVRFTEQSPYADYFIVETDFKDFSLVYSCVESSGNLYFDFAWILSRHREFDESKADRLKTELAGYGVDISKFQKTNQSDCPSSE